MSEVITPKVIIEEIGNGMVSDRPRPNCITTEISMLFYGERKPSNSGIPLLDFIVFWHFRTPVDPAYWQGFIPRENSREDLPASE